MLLSLIWTVYFRTISNFLVKFFLSGWQYAVYFMVFARIIANFCQ